MAIPFKWYPPERIVEQALACRLLDVSESGGNPIDRVIGLKFPAYLIPHPHKILWLLHQFRTAYELWDQPFGDLYHYPNGPQVREAIQHLDQRLIPEAKAVVYAFEERIQSTLALFRRLTSSRSITRRLPSEQFYGAEAEIVSSTLADWPLSSAKPWCCKQ